MQCKDHLGNSFYSIAAMCSYYKVTYITFKKRIDAGLNLEEALTRKKSSDSLGLKMPSQKSRRTDHTVDDHLGHSFSSIDEMCSYYGIKSDTYYRRRRRGLSVEDALTFGYRECSCGCTDHLGNKYASIKEMCEHYGINDHTYRSRIKKSGSIEEALSVANKYACKDHLGNEYHSVMQMCEHYGVSHSNVSYYTRNGLSVGDALLKVIQNNRVCKDALGNEFSSRAAMCRAHNIGYSLFMNRINNGWSVEDALAMPAHSTRGGVSCTDHLKNEYPSIKAMCRAYNISYVTYRKRIQRGWSLEKALITPTGKL